MGKFLLCLVYILSLALPAHAVTLKERLVFDLSWFGISGGHTIMKIEETSYNGHGIYKISSITRSNKFISMFYPVYDVVESYVDRKTLLPYRFRSIQREGSYRGNKEIVFDRINGVAIFINHRDNDKKKLTPISSDTYDALSVVYYFRHLPLTIGKDINLKVHDGGKNWILVVTPLDKEEVWTPVGTFKTIKVKAQMKYKGLFVHKGDVIVWFTDDEKRIPVKMKSKIRIGHITALLVDGTW